MSSTWKRAMSFLGLVEEYDDEYADLPDENEADAAPQPSAPAPAARTQSSNVRRLSPAAPARSESPVRTEAGYGSRGYGSDAPARRETTQAQTVRPISSARVHVTNPSTFNDVEEVGERFRNGVPTIMNLDGASEAVAKRLLDFASGLIYGLDGRIERVGDRVFLLTPSGTEVSTEERRRLADRGFFNQA